MKNQNYLEKFSEVKNKKRLKVFADELGNMIENPPNFKEMNAVEFANSDFFTIDTWQYHEVRFLNIEGVRSKGHLFHSEDKSGYALVSVWEKGTQVTKYFKFTVCEHEFESCKLGVCKLNDKCLKCGYIRRKF